MVKSKRANAEGSLYQRKDGRWVASITGDNGKRISRYGKTRQEAHKKLLVMQEEKKNGIESFTSKQTMGDLLTEWLESTRNSLRSNTFARYEELIRLHVLPEIALIKISKLQPRHLEKLYNTKLDSGLSATTVGHIHARIHTALNQAMKRGKIFRNVASLVSPPKKQLTEMKTLSNIESKKLLDAAKNEKLESLFTLALTSGLRRGELLALSWNNIDFDSNTLKVSSTLLQDGTFAPPKSLKSRRTVFLCNLAINSLKKRKVIQIKDQLASGSKWNNPRNLIFTDQTGKPLTGSQVRRIFNKLLKQAEVNPIRFHDLRHSTATLLLSLNVQHGIVQDVLGHSNIGITMDTYTHSVPSLQQEAMNKLDDLLTT
tara:strand:+ start:509 stop:1624 length:1116 start_codon:yes stop_codon:yes gene_type:complete